MDTKKQKQTNPMLTDPGEDNYFRDRYTFFIKTIQIYDKYGSIKYPPILVEQVIGSFDAYRLYDTSFIHNDGKLFYFKRIFKNKQASVSPLAGRKSEKKKQYSRSQSKNVKSMNITDTSQ